MMSERKQVSEVAAKDIALASEETQMLEVLRNSIYPGARLDSVRMVLGYCTAQRLDPFSKPVHIVPMSVKEGDRWVTRDTIMPGINLYRIRAERTEHYLGSSEPEFGPVVSRTFRHEGEEITVAFPEWCRVVVTKLVGNVETAWAVKEYWLENYQSKSRKTDCPNDMWQKRPFGQLAKCAEAQALRKAFPDAVGAAPTFEERGIDDAAGAFTDPAAKAEPAAPAPAAPEPKPESRSDAVLAAATAPKRRTSQTAQEGQGAKKAPDPVPPHGAAAETPQAGPGIQPDATPGVRLTVTSEELGEMELGDAIELAEQLLGRTLVAEGQVASVDPVALIREWAVGRIKTLTMAARPIYAALQRCDDATMFGQLTEEFAPIADELTHLTSYGATAGLCISQMAALATATKERLGAQGL